MKTGLNSRHHVISEQLAQFAACDRTSALVWKPQNIIWRTATDGAVIIKYASYSYLEKYRDQS